MSGVDPEQACAAALTGLPEMTPVRLAALLDGLSPLDAWEAVRSANHPGDPRHRFTPAVRATDAEAVGERYARAGVAVLLPGRPGYPAVLAGDPGAPAVLFAEGDPTVVDGRPRVAIVGTRSPTPYGQQVASEMAADLAGVGVVVVSGLAIGIDGSAHAGVVRGAGPTAGPPVAVVGTGLDQRYPPQNERLWAAVASTGAVFSEAALGTPPRPRVFPARNRIIAALSDVVVVVESHHKGGSTYTVEAAARRSIPVCAVPGSVRSRASDGTNQLLFDGCSPVRDATDVMAAVYLARASAGRPLDPVGAVRPRDRTDDGVEPAVGRRLSPIQRSVLDAVDDTPTTLETILIRTDLSIVSAARACDELADRGRLRSGAGWWSKV